MEIMRAKILTLLIIVLSAALLALRMAVADERPLNAALNEQVLRIPGDPARPVMLQVTLFEPNGPGPFPLAVLNHGKDPGDPHFAPRYRSAYAARYYLSRGYAVVMPMLRGFAGSGGTARLGCNAEADGINEAMDIRAVVDAISKRPEIDASRIVVSGQSYGGWNSLAFGALNYPGVKGIVNFAGGRNAPTCGDWQDDLADAAGAFGKWTKVPSIWFYGDNDAVFPEATWRAMYEQYTAAGGQVELVAYGNFMENAHTFSGKVEALPIWTTKIDAFLAKTGLPHQDIHPELLPAPYPKPTHFAVIDDVDAVPYLNEKGRRDYQAFLQIKMRPRVFLLGPQIAVSTYGGFDPLARGIALCQKAGRTCNPYAVDDEVVWPMPTAVPLPTHFAALDNVAAVPYVNAVGHQAYRKFLALNLPRAFVIAQDGAWDIGARGSDPLGRALAMCRQQGHAGCRPYAVDAQVVWPDK